MNENLRQKLTLGGELFDSLTLLLRYFDNLRLSIEAHVENKEEVEQLAFLCSNKEALVVQYREKIKKTVENMKKLEEVSR